MKIAICLNGAMSKIGGPFNTQNSLYNSNPYVNYNICYNSIKRHIVDANKDCMLDFFIHSWNIDLKNDLERIYTPKISLFENNTIYNEEISKKCKDYTDFGGISKSLSIQKSIQLLEQYQNIHNITYDVVISYRPDLILIKDMNMSNYDTTKVSVNKHGECNGDFHFIMNSANISRFKWLYRSLDQGNEYKCHFWIKNYIQH